MLDNCPGDDPSVLESGFTSHDNLCQGTKKIVHGHGKNETDKDCLIIIQKKAEFATIEKALRSFVLQLVGIMTVDIVLNVAFLSLEKLEIEDIQNILQHIWQLSIRVDQEINLLDCVQRFPDFLNRFSK